MAMNDEHGCSLCAANGTERYEFYKDFKKRKMVQYDYRHTDGELFSCCAPTLEAARERRDKWLNTKYNK